MQRLARLVQDLDQTTRTRRRLDLLRDYFETTPHADAAWTLSFLIGRRPPGLPGSRRLRELAATETGLPSWLVETCHHEVGDLAETLALLLPAPTQPDPPPLHVLIRDVLTPLTRTTRPEQQNRLLRQTWNRLDPHARFVWHKILTGGFRIGVSRTLVVRALAEICGVEPAVMAHRLLGSWTPTPEAFQALLNGEADHEPARPYPFFLATPLDAEPERLGDPAGFVFEWKWDGIRAQILNRGATRVVWSRGEEIVSDAFPELARAAASLPDGTVLDGEIVAWRGDRPLPFHDLQRRLGRHHVPERLLTAVPVALIAYDILEADGNDIRTLPLDERRTRLTRILAEAGTRWSAGPEPTPQGELFPPGTFAPPSRREFPIRLSTRLEITTWSDAHAHMDQTRTLGVEGLMLKRVTSPYRSGRPAGDWWKWKVAPLTLDAVLVAAQPGHGRRAGLYTDYTFAVWKDDQLVTIAKAYSGLTDAEIAEVDRFVRANTTARRGPVRLVRPERVFELAFDSLQPSSRHAAGISLRFPRILRMRPDKKPHEADRLEALDAIQIAEPIGRFDREEATRGREGQGLISPFHTTNSHDRVR